VLGSRSALRASSAARARKKPTLTLPLPLPLPRPLPLPLSLTLSARLFRRPRVEGSPSASALAGQRWAADLDGDLGGIGSW